MEVKLISHTQLTDEFKDELAMNSTDLDNPKNTLSILALYSAKFCRNNEDNMDWDNDVSVMKFIERIMISKRIENYP